MANKKKTPEISDQKISHSEALTENLATAGTAVVAVMGKLQFPGPTKFSAALTVVLATHDRKNLKKKLVE